MKHSCVSAICFSALVAVTPALSAPLAQRIVVEIPTSDSGGQERATAVWTALGFHLHRSIPQLGAYVLDVPKSTSMNVAISELTRSRAFSLVEEDKIMRVAMVPNDPDYPSQWSLPKVGFSKAWSKSNGAGVTVAVLDTGITCTIADLVGQCVPGWNVVDNNGNTDDDYGHGTGVAGVIGAVTNNGVELASAAFSAKLMPIKINQDGQSIAYDSDIAVGIVWGADHGAKVENLSYAHDDGSALERILTDAAFYLRQTGGILFQGAGNSGIKMTWPNTSVIDTVSGTDSNNKFVDFSNSGKPIDFAAPAVNIFCLGDDGQVGTCTGTSMSSPLAASVATLMLSVNPTLLPWQVENLMATSTTDKGKTGWDNKFGWGIINAKTSVDNAFADPGPDTTPPDPPFIYSYGYNGTVHFSWNEGYDNTGTVVKYFVFRNGEKIGKTTDLMFIDQNPIHGTTTAYTVKSVDAVRLVSVPSIAIYVTVP